MLLHEIYPAVDFVIIVESTVTYTGNKKQLNFEKNKKMLIPYLDKIRHVVMTPEDCLELECNIHTPHEVGFEIYMILISSVSVVPWHFLNL
jgi:hypothetical protein